MLIRANDAVDKEQRQQAVGELQSRVEDWKGHKIEHFGELLLYGDFTVLKGDGVREVEREVRIIFDALDPKSRAIARRALPHVPAIVHQHLSNKVPALVYQHQLNERLKLPFGLDVVPEEQSEEEATTIPDGNPCAGLIFHTANHDPGDEKLRGLHKSPMKSLFTRSETKFPFQTESPQAFDTSDTLQLQDKTMAERKLRGSQSVPGLFSKFMLSPSPERGSTTGPDTPQNHNGEKAVKQLRSRASLTNLFSKSKPNLPRETESPKGLITLQTPNGGTPTKELRSKGSFTRLFSKSKADGSLETESPKGVITLQTPKGGTPVTELRNKGPLTTLFSKSKANLSPGIDSPKGPDTPQFQDEETAQKELGDSPKVPVKSLSTNMKAIPPPGTDSPGEIGTSKSHDEEEAPRKFRGPHNGPMKSFLAKLSATPSPKLKPPRMLGTTRCKLGRSSESQMILGCSGEGSGSGAGLTPPTPSRKSRSHGSGALANFGHSFRRKTRMPQIKTTDEVFKKICTQVLKAAELQYYFAFNGPLCNRTIFLNFERPGRPGVSAFDNARPRKQHNEEEKANLKGLMAPVSMQYKVYLFERILLCCKEINPNKQKNKMLGNNKSLLDKKGKPRLQLKGRIFMQNVTDVMSIGKAGECYPHLRIYD